MRYIPNENSWFGFAATLTGTMAGPKVADITGAVDLTSLVTGATASTTGSAVPTPSFDSKFNRSIAGTIDATFSIDGYRDDVHLSDLIWITLPRGTNGFIVIARFGGKPSTIGDRCEVWPISVLSRSVPAMTSNTPVGVTVTASVPDIPAEDAVVIA